MSELAQDIPVGLGIAVAFTKNWIFGESHTSSGLVVCITIIDTPGAIVGGTWLSKLAVLDGSPTTLPIMSATLTVDGPRLVKTVKSWN